MDRAVRTRGLSIALALLVMMLVSLVTVVPASANHPANSCLDVTPPTATNQLGTAHTLTATLRQGPQDNCPSNAPLLTPDSGQVSVAFEITGANARAGTPDLECNIKQNESSCEVTYTGTNAGTDTIQAWIDHDKDGVLDAGEPTDTVTKTWAAAANTLDCDDQTGPDTERETNVGSAGTASNEVYTCTATGAGGAAVPAGTVISGEVENGVNDPDATDGASYASPDYTCTVSTGGTCQITVTQNETELGTAEICFWVGTAAEGTTLCGAETTTEGQGTSGADAGNDLADQVEKTWVAGATSLDCDDQTGPDTERETNPGSSGTASTEVYTCTVLTGSGAQGASGVVINAEVENNVNDPDATDGASYGSPDYTCTTTTGGACQISVTQNETELGTAEICFWVGTAAEGGTLCAAEATNENQAAGGGDAGNDLADQVEKTWVAPVQARINCDPETDVNPVGSAHTVTCEATDAAGAKLTGITIDIEVFGTNDPDGAYTPATPDFSCVTEPSGRCAFTHGPGGTGTTTAVGTTTYQAWADVDNSNQTIETDPTEGQNEVTQPGGTAEPDGTDVMTKTWETPRAATCPGFENDTRNQVVGTEGDDVLRGTPGADIICGLGGDDIISGFRGDDILLGGPGSDIIKGGRGNDFLRGGGGDDLLKGGPGNDLLLGGRGNDLMNGGRGRDRCRGGPGRDVRRRCELH